MSPDEETTALTGGQLGTLQKSGLNKEQINIVVHNLDKILSSRQITRESVEIVVHNLVKDEKFQREFFTNPLIAIEKLDLKGWRPSVTGKE